MGRAATHPRGIALNDLAKNVILWIVIAVVLLSVFQSFGTNDNRVPADSLLDIPELRRGTARSRKWRSTTRRVRSPAAATGEQFVTYNPETDNTALIGTLEENNVLIEATPPREPLLPARSLHLVVPDPAVHRDLDLLHAPDPGRGRRSGHHVLRQEPGAAAGARIRFSVTFADVAGIEEAKEEVVEIVDFLKDPGKFQRLGGKIPEGRAHGRLAGHRQDAARAGDRWARPRCRSFTISGSDFVEMFVGVGRFPGQGHVRPGPRNTHRASFSSTKSTPWADIVAPGSAADTTSASRRSTSCSSRWTVSKATKALSSSPRRTVPTCSIPPLLRPGTLRPSGRRARTRRARPRADPQGAHAQGADRQQREALDHRPGHAGLFGRGSRQSRQRGRAARRAREQAHGHDGGVRQGQGQDHDGHGAPAPWS